MIRAHLLALPNVQTTKDYSLDGFCSATIRFAKLLKLLGVHVTLYASEENEAPCDELVTVISKAEQKRILGIVPYQYAALDTCAGDLWKKANQKIIVEIESRKQPRDFIFTIGGSSQASVAHAHPDLMTVEYSIGYVSQFAAYRVYESHYWRAMSTGLQGSWDGRFFDEVIPLFFDETEFQFREKKDPFALFVGRLTPKKGLETACRAAEAAGMPLKVIGHGDTSLVTHGAEYVGAVGQDERNDYMSRATALICPTTYVEPFGSVAVEAQMCGTPVVCPDFGGFIETVQHGITGYRCKYLGEFAKALNDCKRLDPLQIRTRAIELYSIPQVAKQYEAYFKRLNLLWADGWNTL